MEWGFNSPLAHDETADPLMVCGFRFPWLWLGCRCSCFLVLLVVPRVFSGCWTWTGACGSASPAGSWSALASPGPLRALRVRPLGCGSRGDLEGPRDAEVAPLAQEVIMPREGKRAEHVRQPLQLDYWSAITV